MDDTCSYRHSDGQRCMLRAFHPVRHHRFAGDWIVAITDDATPDPNPELAATGACVAALEDLDAEQRAAVVRFLDGRFGNHIAPSGGFVQQMAGRAVRRLV